MNAPPTVQDPANLLAASRATETFKDAVRALSEGRSQAAITANAGAPPVKVLRVALKLIEARPDAALQSLVIEATSGCSNYTGRAVAQPDNLRIDFNWDCAWRAREQGWRDAFGDPDQIRAARTLGYQCFERFEIRE